MSKPDKPGLLIFYDYFFPAYKAGGPIQSLTNLVVQLQDRHHIFVMASGFDLHSDQPLAKVKMNEWSIVTLPGSVTPINVWYTGTNQPGRSIIKAAIEKIKPAVVYLNGIFSYRFVIVPLLAIKKIRIVICPRGMLQPGALAGKSFKKNIYLGLLKISGLVRQVLWHATSEEEKDDIKKIFGGQAKIIVAENIPKKPVAEISYREKKTGELRLIYLSLISSKKNLLQAIEIINGLEANIIFDIYGPVKDLKYWEKCEQLIRSSPGKIKYWGDILPELVQATFEKYDASILLTKGENFGHALYESFSVGRPVITSNFTPWNDLEQKKAGYNVDILNEKSIIIAINKMVSMNSGSFDEYCRGAYLLANEFNKDHNISGYEQLFN